jgi:transcriptional regulator with XRE-family HTH domain
MSETTTGQLIQHYRQLRKLNQSELARLVGIRPQSVQSWESGNTVPRLQILPEVARALGVEVRDLAAGAELGVPAGLGGKREKRAIDSPEMMRAEFAVFDAPPATLRAPPAPPAPSNSMSIKALRTAAALDISVEMIVVSPTWAQRYLPGRDPSKLKGVDVRGDSMEPTLFSGSWVVLDTSQRNLDLDAIWVLRDRARDELYIKRVQRRFDGTWLVISDNPRYQPIEVLLEQQQTIEVVGQVCGAMRFVCL